MPVSEKSLKNLNPAKKGEVRNPKGKPPKLPDLDILMAEVLGEEKDGKTAAQAILAALRAKAAKGDIRAAEVLLNRGYGLPKQKIEHSGDPDNPVHFKLDGRFKDRGQDNS
jgi:hypothetical protein